MNSRNFTYVNARNATINNAGRDQINYFGPYPERPGPCKQKNLRTLVVAESQYYSKSLEA
jgi:hypothetical protein